MLKKIIATTTLTFFILSGIPVSAQMEELSQNINKIQYSDIEDVRSINEISVISDCDIMTGYSDGTFRPNENVTRAEFATILSRALSLDHIAKTVTPKSNFTDVKNDFWAVREIQLLSDKKIVNGYDDGNFYPDGYVTYEQALKLLVEGLGYGSKAKQKGTWPIGYLIAAEEIGLTKNVDFDLNCPLNRMQVAKLLYNALYIKRTDGRNLFEKLGEKYFYVSPNGDDTNPGTEDKPWKTAYKAGKTAFAGTTVIFEDGLYNEANITMVSNSGEAGKPITFKARNPRKAVLKYAGNLVAKEKWNVFNLDYINVRDLSFTQEKKSKDGDPSATMDIFLNALNSTNIEFTGNEFNNIYEEGIKLTYVDSFLLADNEVIASDHEGFDVFCSSNGRIRNNRLINTGRVGVMIKGNSNNIAIHNNYIYNTVPMENSSSHAIGLGGSSNNINPRDINKNTGYEAYNCIAYNNIVISAEKNAIPIGLFITGSVNSQAFNNLVIGCGDGARFRNADGLDKGWKWNPTVTNPVLKNNIFVDCDRGLFCQMEPVNPDVSNNIYYKVKSNIDENGIVADPKFVDFEKGDYHLLPGSPAIDAGVEFPCELPAHQRPFNGEEMAQSVKVEMTDYENTPREGKWDIGIYSVNP